MSDSPTPVCQADSARAPFDIDRLFSDRTRSLRPSGIRRIFEIAATLSDPIDLSIGQPDFAVPDPIKQAAINAIERDHNGYTLTQGIPSLRRRIAAHLAHDLSWPADCGGPDSDVGLIVTSGTLGGLYTAMMATLSADDEIIIGDPYFVAYPHMATLAGGRAIRCDTYPDFRMTAQRVEPLITARTKGVLLNSPGNPSGVVMTGSECAQLRELCKSRGVLLISDEIYDEFTFEDSREPAGLPHNNQPRCPSPCRADGAWEHMLLIRGFGKTYGCTGWRMGYAAGPRALIEQMAKIQQFSFVCAPAPAQHGCEASFDVDMSATVAHFKDRRDRVMSRLAPLAKITNPGGAFYVFFEVPEHLGLTAEEFCNRALDQQLVAIPGGVFSDRDTHVRISYAVADEKLGRGLDVLADLLAR